MLVKDGKFKFPVNENSIKNYKSKYPTHAKEVKLTKKLWDWKTMQNGQYDGGNFDGR